MSDLKAVLAERIRSMRYRSNLSQANLAEGVGSSNYQISRYEAGNIAPSVEKLTALADALGCSTDFLLGRTDDPGIDEWQDEGISLDELSLLSSVREGNAPEALRVLATLLGAAEQRRNEYLAGNRTSPPLASKPLVVHQRIRRSPRKRMITHGEGRP